MTRLVRFIGCWSERKGDNVDSKPKFVDEEDRHPVAGDKGPQLGSQLVERQEATPAMWSMVGYDPAHTGRCPHDPSAPHLVFKRKQQV